MDPWTNSPDISSLDGSFSAMVGEVVEVGGVEVSGDAMGLGGRNFLKLLQTMLVVILLSSVVMLLFNDEGLGAFLRIVCGSQPSD